MLQVKDLHAAYGPRRVLHGVSLEVDGGEVVGLVGPNGAGKSTLLKVISGVVRPVEGCVLLLGKDAQALRPGERARLVAVVPQVPSLPATFKALDVVFMGRTPRLGFLRWEGRRDLEVVRGVMEQTDTWHLAHRPLGSLSGGERQRLLIARALAQETPLLLLDEPTASLDLAHQTRVMDLVARLQRVRQGATLVAMHDLTLAARYCNRIALLRDGLLLAHGTPQEVLTMENISRAYETQAYVLPHPLYGTPVVLPLSEEGSDKSVETPAGSTFYRSAGEPP